MQNKKVHQGRNIKRFREMLGIKQEAPAAQSLQTLRKNNPKSGDFE